MIDNASDGGRRPELRSCNPAELTETEAANLAVVITVACPQCGVGPGELCVARLGAGARITWHHARAVAAALDEDQDAAEGADTNGLRSETAPDVKCGNPAPARETLLAVAGVLDGLLTAVDEGELDEDPVAYALVAGARVGLGVALG